MGIYEDTTNNIKYDNVSKGVGFSKISNNRTDFELDDIVPVVNAVEIDWNGAQLGDKEINTTGELLSH